MMMLVNPAAGRGGFRQNLGPILETLWNGGWRCSVFFSDSPGSVHQLVHNHAPDYDRLVCLGGDGTLSRTIGGLMSLPRAQRPPLGYIPLGTANDVANSLELPREPLQAARRILDGSPRALDVGLINGSTPFTYVAAFGAFTEVSYVTPSDAKKTLGHFAYVLEALNHIPRPGYGCTTHVEFDNGAVSGNFLFGGVFNTTSLGGVVRLSDSLVSLQDGLFEVILVRASKSADDLKKILDGIINQRYQAPAVYVRQCEQVRFTFREPVPWTRDGENGGIHSTLHLKNCNHAIQIIS